MRESPAVVLISGIMAAGKSTVAEGLARRLPRAVHLRGNVFRRMIVSGRADMTAEPTGEALRQLRLRYDLAASAADRYASAGFTVALQDVILGPDLPAVIGRIRHRPLAVVVLAPTPRWSPPASGTGRRRGTATGRWRTWMPGSVPAPPDRALAGHLRQTPDETVTEILARAWTDGQIG